MLCCGTAVLVLPCAPFPLASQAASSNSRACSLQVWNGMFSQTQYALDRGKALQLDPDAYTALCKFYSRRAQQVSR